MSHPTVTHLTNYQAAKVSGRSVATIWRLARAGVFGPLSRVPRCRAVRIPVSSLEAVYGHFEPAEIEAAVRTAGKSTKRRVQKIYTPHQLQRALGERDAAWRGWIADKRSRRRHPNGPPSPI